MDTNTNNSYNKEDLQNLIKHSTGVMAQSFDKFLYETSYSKCFPKGVEHETLKIKAFFDFFIELYDFVPYIQLNEQLTKLRDLLMTFQHTLTNDYRLPVTFDLLKRLSLDECIFTNEQEKFVLYLDNNHRIVWNYTNTFPFLNQLFVNDYLAVSYLFDRIKDKQPDGYPPGHVVDEEDGAGDIEEEDLSDRFERLLTA